MDVVVHQAHRLHERVDRRGSDEGPAALLQVLRQRRRLGRRRHGGQDLARDPARTRRPCGLPAPEVGRQRPEFGRQLLRALRVVDRRFDLAAMADDARVAEQPLDVARLEPRDALELEIGEAFAKSLALAQDREPAQARLEALEADLLEQAAVVGDRESPLAVVVGDVELVIAAPPAAARRLRCRGRLSCRDSSGTHPSRHLPRFRRHNPHCGAAL